MKLSLKFVNNPSAADVNAFLKLEMDRLTNDYEFPKGFCANFSFVTLVFPSRYEGYQQMQIKCK